MISKLKNYIDFFGVAPILFLIIYFSFLFYNGKIQLIAYFFMGCLLAVVFTTFAKHNIEKEEKKDE